MAIPRLPVDDITVLVVDDDDTTRGLLRRSLTIMGATPLEATDGSSGLRIVHETHPNLVIIDLNMEPVGGMAMLGGMRSSADTKVAATGVLMFTGDNDAAARHKASLLGVDGYIVKPFSPIGFAEKVADSILKRRQLPPAP